MAVSSLSAEKILSELKKCGVTHILTLPSSETRFMYDAMKSQHDIELIPVCREGESIAIATGLILGGKKPVVMNQNTGFLESGDSVRGFCSDLRLPYLFLIGYRGWRNNAPFTDSAAVFTEPTLDAWGIKHYLIKTDEDLDKISMAYNETQETKRPVAILIGWETK